MGHGRTWWGGCCRNIGALPLARHGVANRLCPPSLARCSGLSLIPASSRSSSTMPRRLPRKLIQPLQQFIQTESSGGIVLLACAAVALLWANSPWGASYERLWQTPLTVGPPGASLREPLHLWINDALMAVFFLLVGLEIKREVL